MLPESAKSRVGGRHFHRDLVDCIARGGTTYDDLLVKPASHECHVVMAKMALLHAPTGKVPPDQALQKCPDSVQF